MKVLIDTNVLVSAALRDKDPETVILYIAAQADIEWIVSPAILAEYQEVLGRSKFGLPDEVQRQWREMLGALTTVVEADVAVDFPRDQKDAKFLACALAADAECFITGDRDFTEARKLLNTTILSVSMFKRLVCDAPP
jgi:putative PIN family toxin of toxin-antitoxin system